MRQEFIEIFARRSFIELNLARFILECRSERKEDIYEVYNDFVNSKYGVRIVEDDVEYTLRLIKDILPLDRKLLKIALRTEAHG